MDKKMYKKYIYWYIRWINNIKSDKIIIDII